MRTQPLLRLLTSGIAIFAIAALCGCAGAPPDKQQPPNKNTPAVGGTLPAMTFATCDGSKSYSTEDLKKSDAKLLLLTGHTMW